MMHACQIRRYVILGVLCTLVVAGWPRVSPAVSLLTNGDFASSLALAGWTPDPPSASVSEPTGAFAVIGDVPTDGSGRSSLEQSVTSALPLHSFAFDFVFATAASPGSVLPPGVFPDSFFVSITTPGTLLDLLFVDVVLGVDAAGVTLAPGVTIAGFLPSFTSERGSLPAARGRATHGGV
jgi:hypothetical protein